jgi:hypothetical protein
MAVKRRVSRGGWRVLAAACALTFCGTTAARAQDPQPAKTYPYAIKAGIFLPSQGTMRNQAGGEWWNFGAEYAPNFRYKPLGADVLFDIDFSFRDNAAGRTSLDIPLTAKLQVNLTPVGSKFRIFGGIGGGVHFINSTFRGLTIQPGLRLTLGVDLTSRLFVEATYDYVGGYTDDQGFGVRTDGFRIVGGWRF